MSKLLVTLLQGAPRAKELDEDLEDGLTWC